MVRMRRISSQFFEAAKHTAVFCFIMGTFISAESPQLSQLSEINSPNCDQDCSSTRRNLICGSDGRTYNSECEISQANCRGHLVTLRHVGECSDQSRCLVARANAQEMARRPAAGVFIPDCNSDGSYVDVQCHIGTGYCWCVNTQGKPIPGSSARYKRPNCIAYQNANSHKRISRGKKPRRACSISDRDEFNRNMNRIFDTEYNRTQDHKNDSPLTQRAADWKFTMLDINKNNLLSKSELRDLRRMVKKIIRPRPCARTFTQYCDLDQSKNITRQEWIVCLAVESDGPSWLLRGHHPPPERPRLTGPLADTVRGRQVQSLRRLLATSNTAPPQMQLQPAGESHSLGSQYSWRDELRALSAASLEGGLLAGSQSAESTEKRRDPGKKKKPNCAAERTKALAKQARSPDEGIYVPSCEKTGRYSNVQCHSATNYCWCVNPENGRPIPDTSTHNSQPNCNVAAARPLRGCHPEQKTQFLANLHVSLINDMTSSLVNSTPAVPNFKPSQSDAFRWKFRTLDTNQNAYIERQEWRSFKQFLAIDEKLAKCGRGFFKFCDIDESRRISVDEWLQCVSLTHDNLPRKLPVNLKRKGSNPLTKYLKPD